MPKKIQAKGNGTGSSNGNGRFTISYGTIGVLGSILVMVITLWTIGSRIATKADVDTIKALLEPVLDKHEARIRDLELQMARYFGASQTGIRQAPSAELEQDLRKANLVLAQYVPMPIPDAGSSANAPSSRGQYPIPARRPVVPVVMIREYSMEPTRGGAYALLGEDGRYYSLDDVLAILIQTQIRSGEHKAK